MIPHRLPGHAGRSGRADGGLVDQLDCCAIENHALRAGPFVTLMLVCLLLASQGIFEVSQYIGTQVLIVNVLIMSGLLIAYSIILSLALLNAWASPRLNGGGKIAIVGIALIVSALIAAGSALV